MCWFVSCGTARNEHKKGLCCFSKPEIYVIIIFKRSEKMKEKNHIKNLTLTGLFAACFCICGPLTIPLPISPVPLSIILAVIFISNYIIGTKKSTIAVCIYILIGIIGIPVFSGFHGGLSIISGPTGGYILGYVFCSAISGIFINKFSKPVLQILGMALGTLSAYLLGTFWFVFSQKTDFLSALILCVLPYILGDILKIIFSFFLGNTLKKRIRI